MNAKGGRTYAPKLFAETFPEFGVTQSGYTAAMRDLMARGDVVEQERGRASKRRTRLVPCAPA